MQTVWYVAYGSNLGMENGSAATSPAAGQRPEIPSTQAYGNPPNPGRIFSLHVPGGLVFAGQSGVWGGGAGVASTPPATAESRAGPIW